MKKLLLTIFSLALCLSVMACLTETVQSWGTSSKQFDQSTGQVEIDFDGVGNGTTIVLPQTSLSQTDEGAMLIALPAQFKVKLTLLNSNRDLTKVILQYRNKSNAWVTIRAINNPTPTSKEVSWFGLYPLDGKMGYGVGEVFYLRMFITDDLSETLDFEEESIPDNNPYYFKFKVDSNRRAH